MLYRSASSPHVGTLAFQSSPLQPQQQPAIGTRLAAAQHPSHGSLASFAPPHAARPLPAAPPAGHLTPNGINPTCASGGGGGGGGLSLSRGSSHPNLASLGGGGAGGLTNSAVAGAGTNLAQRFSASQQQFGLPGGGGAFDGGRAGSDAGMLDALRTDSLRVASGGFAAGAVGGLDTLRSG